MRVSVIMPVERIGGDAERAIESVLRQEAPFPFELILVSAAPLAIELGTGVRNVIEPNRNPATRRNRAVSEAAGEILAFIDDDAIADAGWLATAVWHLDVHGPGAAVGGARPVPVEAALPEIVAD